MSHLKNTGFADRISAQQEAKKAMLAKFKPKPAVQDPDFDKREELRAAELEAVRAARAEAKEKARLEALAREEELMAAKRAERAEALRRGTLRGRRAPTQQRHREEGL